MISGIFDGLWGYGMKLFALDGTSEEGREFRGFLEPMNPRSASAETRNKAGVLPTEKYFLLAEPAEAFTCGGATTIIGAGMRFEFLNVREVFDGDKVSHRECVLLKVGEVESNA